MTADALIACNNLRNGLGLYCIEPELLAGDPPFCPSGGRPGYVR